MPERIPNGVAKKVVFRAIASADHFSPATSKTIAITISKNGATSFSNPAAGATNATEMASGFYKFDLGTGDTDTNGPLAWRGAGTGVDDIGDVYEVVAATNAGFSALPAVAAGSSGGVLDAAGVRSAIGLATANLDTQLDALPTAIENADALLDRNMATGADNGSPSVRTPRQALRFLRNKWSISGTTLTVTKEDDTDASWTAIVTTSSTAEPITGSDPA